MEDNSQSYNNTNQTQLDSSTNENTSVTLIRTGYSREAFNSTFNTDFTQLGVNEQDLTFFDPNLATVEDFFNIYNNLFFIIPKYGEINSHEYLIKESSDYIDYQANQLEIEALLEEIAELRESNLQLQVDMAGILGAKQEIDKAIEQGRNTTTPG
jgi:hypothetical protein|tara:strand:+ start:147 stop:611 length:465 start_codon:yes stop_codon:yes gene_type:complete